MKKFCFFLLGGALVYLAADLCVVLTCLDIPDPVFSAVLPAVFLFGIALTIFLLSHHHFHFPRPVFRGLALQIGFWSMFLVDALTGITRSFVSLPQDNYGGGLVLLCFWLSFSAVSIAVILCIAAAGFLSKKRNH